MDLTVREKIIALEVLKGLREKTCRDCQKVIDTLVLQLAYS